MDPMLEAYLTCALWTSDYWLSRYGVLQFDPSSLYQARLDCMTFREKAGKGLLEIMTPAQAGHDFWLTRNRHGCGFWSRGYGKDRAVLLTQLAHEFPECHIELGGDGLLYITM